MGVKQVGNAAVLAVLISAVSLLVGEQFTPLGMGSVQVVLASNPLIYAGTFSVDYCLSSWIKVSTLPTGTVKPATLQTSSKTNLGLGIDSLGNIWAYADLYTGSAVSITASQVLVANAWLLVAGCACGDQLSIAAVQYQGFASFASLAVLSSFIEYDPRHSLIQAYDGATALTAQMMALTLTIDSCLTADVLTSQAAACSPYCESCTNPASCSEYVQLVDPFTAATVTHATPLTISATDWRFDGRDYSSLDIAVTGWFRNTYTGSMNLIKVANNPCEAGALPQEGCRVLSLYANTGTTTLSQFFDTAMNVNVGITSTLAGFELDKWYFFTASNCAGTAISYQCISSFSSTNMSPPACSSTAITAPSFPFHRSSATASISLGTTIAGGITGQILDVRYYQSRCIASTEAQSLLTKKQGPCLPGCSLCTPPATCQTCIDGYYLNSGNCLRCNSCCQTCALGSASYQCITCASACTLVANTCLRNHLFSLLSSM